MCFVCRGDGQLKYFLVLLHRHSTGGGREGWGPATGGGGGGDLLQGEGRGGTCYITIRLW